MASEAKAWRPFLAKLARILNEPGALGITLEGFQHVRSRFLVFLDGLQKNGVVGQIVDIG